MKGQTLDRARARYGKCWPAREFLGVSPISAALLITRGCDDQRTARSVLTPSYDQLHDPNLMLGMEKAAARRSWF